VISRHLRNVFKEGDLEQEATVVKNATVQRKGSREVVTELFKQFRDNESFKRWMTDTVFGLTYDRLQAGG